MSVVGSLLLMAEDLPYAITVYAKTMFMKCSDNHIAELLFVITVQQYLHAKLMFVSSCGY